MGEEKEKNGNQSEKEGRGQFPTLSRIDSVEEIGTQIGSYKLLSVLGEGGFGIVYRAEQKEPVRRQVALKVIKPGMDSKQVIARFESERQALALLEHPNIARVFDGGTTESGRPYFVMELVKGPPITEYCDEQKLSIEERLELFRQVCEAVQHAHQKGIIHRDIKPSNILVSVQAGKPVPIIIDFGVAKAISQPLTERTLFTEQGQFIGTPEYMSPEQAGMTIQGIDTRSDIYSLGVVLYEMLTGTLPFSHDELGGAGFAEIQRIIRETDPPRPSTRLSSLGEEAKKVAERRHTGVAALTKRLHKELEWIPLKAMRKEPDRRYKTASEFAADVRNYLNGDPLIAGPESRSYRVKKFVRKHTGPIVSSAIILVVLIIGLMTSITMYFQAEEQREIAIEALIAKDTALVEAERAREQEAAARVEAEKAQTTAEQQREAAEENAEAYKRQVYAHLITLSNRLCQEGSFVGMRETLISCSEDLRNWEWYYLWNLYIAHCFKWTDSQDGSRKISTYTYCQPFTSYEQLKTVAYKKLIGHKSDVVSVGFSGDCKRLVSMSRGGETTTYQSDKNGKRRFTIKTESEIIVWDIESAKVIEQVKIPDIKVYNFCTDPNGSKIAISTDREVLILDLDGTILKRKETRRLRSTSPIVWSPDGRYIAFDSISEPNFDGILEIWDVDNDEILHSISLRSNSERTMPLVRNELYDSDNAIYCLLFSPDSSKLTAGTNFSMKSNRTLRVWDVKTGEEQMIFGDQDSIITNLSFSPDGKYLVSSLRDNAISPKDKPIRIWDFEKGSVNSILKGNFGPVTSISYNCDSSRLASGSDTVRIWDPKIGTVLLSISHSKADLSPRDQKYVSAEYRVKFSPDGKSLAIWGSLIRGDYSIRVLIAASQKDVENW